MTEFSWLASYPKSGSTWFRMLVANLAAGDEPADINAASGRGGIASARGEFQFHTFIDSGLLTPGKTGLWAKGAGGAVFDDFRIDKKG